MFGGLFKKPNILPTQNGLGACAKDKKICVKGVKDGTQVNCTTPVFNATYECILPNFHGNTFGITGNNFCKGSYGAQNKLKKELPCLGGVTVDGRPAMCDAELIGENVSYFCGNPDSPPNMNAFMTPPPLFEPEKERQRKQQEAEQERQERIRAQEKANEERRKNDAAAASKKKDAPTDVKSGESNTVLWVLLVVFVLLIVFLFASKR